MEKGKFSKKSSDNIYVKKDIYLKKHGKNGKNSKNHCS
jgi:hypothetical protein